MLVFVGHHAATAQPRLTATARETSVQAGRPFFVNVEVQWLGAPDRYDLSPPSLELPDGVEKLGQEQSFSTRGEETIYDYEFELVASNPGPLELGEVSVAYQGKPESDAEPDRGTVKEMLPTVTVLPGGIRGILGTALSWVLLVVLLLLPLAWFRRRAVRREQAAEAHEQPPESTPKELLERAHKCLTEGDFDGVYALLIDLKPGLPPATDPLPPADKLEAERMRIRYGGVTPSADEVRRLLRTVSLALENREAPG